MIATILLMIGQGIVTALVILSVSTIHNKIRTRSFAKLFKQFCHERLEADAKVKTSTRNLH